jgi:hypothetical protein
VVIEDPAFARALAASIRGDMRPETAWVIGRRDKAPVFSGLDYSLAKMSEAAAGVRPVALEVRDELRVRPRPGLPVPCRATPPVSGSAIDRRAVSRGQRFLKG